MAINDIEAVLKCLPTKKSSKPDRLPAELYQAFKEELIFWSAKWKGKEYYQIYYIEQELP